MELNENVNNNHFTVKIIDDRIAEVESIIRGYQDYTYELEEWFTEYLNDNYDIDEDTENEINYGCFDYTIRSMFNEFLNDLGCCHVTLDISVMATMLDSHSVSIMIGLRD